MIFPFGKRRERESHKRSSIQSLFNRGGAESTRVPCILHYKRLPFSLEMAKFDLPG